MALDLGQDLSAGDIAEPDREFVQAALEQRKDLRAFRRQAFRMALAGALFTWLVAIYGVLKLLHDREPSTQAAALVGVTFSVSVVLMLSSLRAVFSRPKDGSSEKETEGLPATIEALKGFIESIVRR